MFIFLRPLYNKLGFKQYKQNNKILVKKFFDWTIMGGATIIPRSPRTTRNEKKFQDRPKKVFF